MTRLCTALTTRRLMTGTALTLLLAGAAGAQDAATPPATAAAPITLDPVILTGGLSPVEADAFGRAATVLTAEDIEKRGAATVQDALRALPGVSFSSSGSSLGEVRLRGGEWRHTMVLIDGINAAGGEGVYNFGGIDLADVDRIEVLRGPQSAYYGSAAASGVINIITRKADATGGYARAEVGNGGAAALGYAKVTDRLRLQVDAGYRDDKGHDVSAGDAGDDDGLRRATLSFSGEWRATDDLRLGFLTRHAEERVWFDGTNYAAATAEDYGVDAPYYSDRTERLNTLWAESDAMDGRVRTRLSLEKSSVDLDSHDSYPFQAEYQRRALKLRSTVGLDGAVDDARQTLAVALDRTEDRAFGGVSYARDTNSVALEYRASHDSGLDVQLGLRRDDNDGFADATSWSAGLSWRVPDSGLRLHASAGKGILNPQSYQLIGGYGAVGNPDLQPEENRSVDLGVEYALPGGRGMIDVTWFRERLENAIAYSYAPLPDGTNYHNLDGTSTREGIEVSGRYDLTDTLTLGASYTYLDARNPDGTAAARRPRHELGLTATLQTFGGKGWVSADLRHVADLQDAGRELSDFTVVNVAASHELSDKLRLTGRINNLLDEAYSETWGYAAPGRTAWIGIEQKW